ncbi:hypothetical protein AMTRI_Chr09g17320 [Amborella trichopoda]
MYLKYRTACETSSLNQSSTSSTGKLLARNWSDTWMTGPLSFWPGRTTSSLQNKKEKKRLIEQKKRGVGFTLPNPHPSPLSLSLSHSHTHTRARMHAHTKALTLHLYLSCYLTFYLF